MIVATSSFLKKIVQLIGLAQSTCPGRPNYKFSDMLDPKNVCVVYLPLSIYGKVRKNTVLIYYGSQTHDYSSNCLIMSSIH